MADVHPVEHVIPLLEKVVECTKRAGAKHAHREWFDFILADQGCTPDQKLERLEKFAWDMYRAADADINNILSWRVWFRSWMCGYGGSDQRFLEYQVSPSIFSIFFNFLPSSTHFTSITWSWSLISRHGPWIAYAILGPNNPLTLTRNHPLRPRPTATQNNIQIHRKMEKIVRMMVHAH